MGSNPIESTALTVGTQEQPALFHTQAVFLRSQAAGRDGYIKNSLFVVLYHADTLNPDGIIAAIYTHTIDNRTKMV